MPVYPSRYKILAPAAVDKVASDPKKAAEAILESTGLDPDQYRLGHTKACYLPPSPPIERAYYHLAFSIPRISPIVRDTYSDTSSFDITADKIWPIGKVI